MKNSILMTAMVSILLFNTGASATALSTATERIYGELGSRTVLLATTTCDLNNMMGNGGGNLGLVNQIPCIINNLSLSGTTGTDGVTRSLTVSGQNLTAHIVIVAPGPTVNGTTYAYETKIWTCGTGCTSATNFLPAIYMAFNADTARTVNNGILINNFSANSGQLKGTSFVKWDTGSATTNKFFDLSMVDCSSSPTTAILAHYTRVGDISTLNDLVSQASGSVTRTATAWNNVSNAGNYQTDTTVSAGGDSPSWDGGFTRATSGDDYTYSAGTTGSFTIGAYPTGMSGTTLSGATMQGVSCASIYTTGVPAVTVGTGVISPVLTTPMNGMTTNPANI